MASRGRGASQRGANAERAVVTHLRERGYRAERIRSGRSTDPGDIAIPDQAFLMDVKSQDRWRIPDWFTEAEQEADAEQVLPMLILHRPNHGNPADWLVVIRMEDMTGWTKNERQSGWSGGSEG